MTSKWSDVQGSCSERGYDPLTGAGIGCGYWPTRDREAIRHCLDTMNLLLRERRKDEQWHRAWDATHRTWRMLNRGVEITNAPKDRT